MAYDEHEETTEHVLVAVTYKAAGSAIGQIGEHEVPPVRKITTVGIIVREDKVSITIARDTDGEGQYQFAITIPKTAVEDVAYLLVEEIDPDEAPATSAKDFYAEVNHDRPTQFDESNYDPKDNRPLKSFADRCGEDCGFHIGDLLMHKNAFSNKKRHENFHGLIGYMSGVNGLGNAVYINTGQHIDIIMVKDARRLVEE